MANDNLQPRGDQPPEGVPQRLPALRTGALPTLDTSAARLVEPEVPLHWYLRVLRERWRLIVFVTLVVTGGVAVGTYLTEPSYRATATIEIRRQAAEVAAKDPRMQQDRISDQYLQTEYGTLRSRTLLERTLNDPALAVQTQRQLPFELQAGAGLSTLVNWAQKRVIVDPVTGSRFVRVSFESKDPQLSADVVNGMLRQYRSMRQESATEAVKRLSEHGEEMRGTLLAAERELHQYLQESGLSSIMVAGVESESLPHERLRKLQQELTAAETESFRTSSQATESIGEARSEALESDILRSLRVRLADLELEYARLRPMFTDSFPRMQQLRSEITQLDSLIALEQGRVSAVLAWQHNSTVRRRQLLEIAVDEQQRILESFAASLAEYQRRQRDLETLKQLYEGLQQAGKEAALSAALAGMDVHVLDAAAPPRMPLRPRPARDVPLGALTGLLLGVGLAFVRTWADSSLRTPQDAQSISNTPLLAMIPSVPQRRVNSVGVRLARGERGWHRIDGGSAPEPQLAEAFRALRTSVLLSDTTQTPRVLLVTSSLPGEGKTTVAANLAISLAMLNRRVLLVDADMRKPSQHRLFGLARGAGLGDYLSGTLHWRTALREDVRSGLDVLQAGRSDSNPSDLLSGARMSAFFADAALGYDTVIVDAPALSINVADAHLIARAVDGVLLVVRSGYTSRDAVRQLIAITPKIIGIVLNQLNPNRVPGYYSDYAEIAGSGHLAHREPVRDAG
jgi:polysaccharide biosynthesis transport protein